VWWLAVLCGAARGQVGRLRHGSALRRAPPPSIGGQEGRRGPPLFPMPGGDDVDAEARLGGSGDGEGGSGRCEGGSGRGEGGSVGDGGDGTAGPQRLLVFTVGAFGGGGGAPQVSLPHVDLAPFLLPGRIWSEAASPSIPAATTRIHGETAPTYGNGADPARMTSPAADPARWRPRRRIQRGAVAPVLGCEWARRWARDWARRRVPGFFLFFSKRLTTAGILTCPPWEID